MEYTKRALLPIECLCAIAALDTNHYRRLLAIGRFAKHAHEQQEYWHQWLISYTIYEEDDIYRCPYIKLLLVPYGRDISIAIHTLGHQLHHPEIPAIISYNKHTGDVYYEWWYMGQRHRADGPAVLNQYNQLWYRDGILTGAIATGPPTRVRSHTF
jgi:hypothetical protein